MDVSKKSITLGKNRMDRRNRSGRTRTENTIAITAARIEHVEVRCCGPGCRIHVRPIGVFHMTDEKGPDEKVLCVPLGDPSFERIRDIHDVTVELRDEIEHFFQRYKDLEPSKRTETRGWGNRSEALTILTAARSRAE